MVEDGVTRLRACKAQGVGLLVLGGIVADNVPAVPGAEEVGVAFVGTPPQLIVAAAALTASTPTLHAYANRFYGNFRSSFFFTCFLFYAR